MKTICKAGLLRPINSKIAVTFLTMILMSSHMWSQSEKPNSNKLYGGFGHFICSAEQLNLGNLNNSLSADGYGTLNKLSTSFGGGGNFCVRNFLLGGGGAWLAGERTHNTNNALELKGGYGYFNIGFVAYAGKRSILYPKLAIGGGGYDITVSKINISDDFSKQLSNPGEMATISSGGWFTSFDVCYQIFLSENNMAGYCVGIKAGYRFSPGGWQTRINKTELTNAPKINLNGLSFGIILGGGALSTN